jgi:inorganic pyrophosphatase
MGDLEGKIKVRVLAQALFGNPINYGCLPMTWILKPLFG